MLLYCATEEGKEDTSLKDAGALGEMEMLKDDNSKASEDISKRHDFASNNVTSSIIDKPLIGIARSVLYMTWSEH